MLKDLTKIDNKKINGYNLSKLLENSNGTYLPNITEILQNLNQIDDSDSLCSFVCDNVKKIIHRGYVFVTYMETDETTMVLKSMKGFNDKGLVNSTIRLLGQDPRGTKFSTKDMTESELASFRSGRLELLPGGMYALFTRKFPKIVCTALEKLLKINFVYTIGFTHHSHHLGGVSILLDSRIAVEKNISIIENIVTQAAIYLSRIHSEVKLKESLFYNRALIEASLDPLVAINQYGKITDVNKATEKIIGLKHRKLVGSDFSDYFTEPDKASEGYKKVLSEGSLRDYPLTIKNLSGKFSDVLYNASLYKNEKGELQGVFAAARDITMIKKTEEDLNRSNERLSLAQRSAGVGVWDWDMNTEKLSWSDELYNLFGLDPKKDTASFDTWHKVLHPDDRPVAEKRLNESIKEHKPLSQEYRIIKPSSEVFWINAMGDTIYNEHGKALRMAGICLDITEKKKKEEEIISLSKFPEENPNPIGRIGYDGKLLYCNQNCIKKYGHKNIKHNHCYLKLQDIIKKIASENSYETENVEITIDDRTFLFTVVPIKGQNYINYYGVDVTNHKNTEKALELSYKKSKKILDETIETLAAIVEIRDPYTSGHQKKVAEIASLIAKELGFQKDKVNAIKTAATIHDIGKITIAASILAKPGKISQLEYGLIKTHPEAGYSILKKIDFSQPIAKIVLQHHERLNGSGYPKGLKSDDIMIGAKIIAVADVVEAMASHRPYRPSLGIYKALKEIKKNKAILYDPDVVDACIKVIKEKGFKF
jgi:PAS domain S-box-containing protein/putative nucleotidyltransferase with HDIG domain